MRPSADFRTASTALLTVEGAGQGYAIPGASIMSIEHVADWSGEPPLDAAAMLGLPALEGELELRVAVLDAGDRPVPLLLHGKLALLPADAVQLLPLPSALQSLTPLVSHVAVLNGKPTYLVLSPARLARARSSAPAEAVSDSR